MLSEVGLVYSELHPKIRAINDYLYYNWDPIGVTKAGSHTAPIDEYLTYAIVIFGIIETPERAIDSRRSIRVLKYLQFVREKLLGLSQNIAVDKKAASDIVETINIMEDQPDPVTMFKAMEDIKAGRVTPADKLIANLKEKIAKDVKAGSMLQKN